ncbi:MAG: DUF3224 domain-containing protein [Tabrizicola sp.]|nr:DUF3224 domain-containing protein [Tabrizicola sp.]
MTSHARGTFEVKLTPQDDRTAGRRPGSPGRMLIDKQFHGDLEAVSKGQMLAAMTNVKDSAGYVAMERVSGTLAGRKGSFVLQHSGTMTRGVPQLSITVVPDAALSCAERAGGSGRHRPAGPGTATVGGWPAHVKSVVLGVRRGGGQSRTATER